MVVPGPARSEGLYISAKEAAAALGVSIPTLYAYVSRGLIRSQGVAGSRNRRYWKVDIERLERRRLVHEPAQSQPGSGEETKPLLDETQITLLTERGLYYRGRDVAELAETDTFESVAALLWESDPRAVFGKSLPSAPASLAKLRRSLADLTVLEQALALFPLIERANPRSYDLSKAGFARTGADLSRWFAAIVVGANGPSETPVHEFIAASLGAPQGFADIIRRLLIVAADHEFDPTTYAVRATANTGVTPYYAVVTGIIASRGQRLQSGRAEAAARLLEEILSIADPRDSIVARFRNGEQLVGFSSPVHDKMDPRAAILMDALQRRFGDDPELKRLRRAADTAAEISGALMEFILPAIFVGRRLGLKGQELSIASLGRMAGWIAHAMEQYHGHPLIRPRARYTGPLPK
ncbi:MAG TPA: citrate synthase [Steroidobacteraceae bacterium]|nr:citrate synthase [Steroidobacteraceae bacterium]